MAALLDKSLDDLITEQKSKSKSRPEREQRERRHDRGSDRQRGRNEGEREAPRGGAGASYWQHDDRADPPPSTRQQSGRMPAAGQRWERGQQPHGGSSGRAASRNTGAPIVTDNDGWEEVAQDEPQHTGRNSRERYGSQQRYGGSSYRSYDRDGGSRAGPQRRGGVFDRLGPTNDAAAGSYANVYGGSSSRGYERDGGFRGGRGGGRGAAQPYDPAQEDRPKRPKYYDEHDHRDEPRGGRGRRYEPYSRGGFRGRGRGGLAGVLPRGKKWGHDLFEETAAAADAAVDAEAPEEGQHEEAAAGEENGDMQE